MTYDELWHRLTPLYEPREAKAIVRLVLEEVFGWSMVDILCGKVTHLSADDQLSLEKIFSRLEKAEPVQYVLGKATFCGRSFTSAPGVLVPRPETEELCRWIINEEHPTLPNGSGFPSAASALPGNSTVGSGFPAAFDILDIGTGSGCIAATLALELPGTRVMAWDISPAALEVARGNAQRLQADVDCQQQDALHAPEDRNRWDIIVSNPPYICVSEAKDMAPNVLDYEPHVALFVPDDAPLRFYRAIGRYARQALKPGGRLYCELNPLYASQVADMFTALGLADIELRQDEYGKTRFARAERRIEELKEYDENDDRGSRAATAGC